MQRSVVAIFVLGAVVFAAIAGAGFGVRLAEPIPAESVSTVFVQGIRAALNGIDPQANPETNDVLRRAWLNGYLNGLQSHQPEVAVHCSEAVPMNHTISTTTN